MFNYSIIIPHYNNADDLQRCLDSIPVREDVQIIVVDDNSDPTKVDFEHFPGLGRVFYDGDECFNPYHFNVISNALQNPDVNDELLFARLLSNSRFRDKFYARFGYLLTNCFDSSVVLDCLADVTAIVDAEISSQACRFGMPVSKNKWQKDVKSITDIISYRVLNMAKTLYYFYYYNGWQFNASSSRLQRRFKIKQGDTRPTFMLRMALQFKDWRYVEIYHDYMRLKRQEDIKSSGIYKWLRSSWLHRKLNG